MTAENGKIYYMGGCFGVGGCDTQGYLEDAVQVYDPDTQSWSLGAPMPVTRGNFAAVLGPDGRIYAIGGNTMDYPYPTDAVDAYDPGTNTWTIIRPLPAPVIAQAAGTGADGLIYVIGGCSQAPDECGGLVQVYDPSTGTWTTQTPSLNLGGSGTAVTAPDGRIYVAGVGSSSSTDVLDTNPAREGWTTVPSGLDSPWFGPAAVAVGGDGRVYVMGGLGLSKRPAGSDSVAAYGPIPSLSPAAAYGGTAVMAGGHNFAANANVSVYWGTVATGTLLGTGTTDGSGNVNSFRVTIPVGAPTGTYPVTFEDDASQYPVKTWLQVVIPPVPTATATPVPVPPTATVTAVAPLASNPPGWHSGAAMPADGAYAATATGLDGRSTSSAVVHRQRARIERRTNLRPDHGHLDGRAAAPEQ